MNYKILQPEEYIKISELAESVELEEKIDFKCTFLAATNGSLDIEGAAGVDLNSKWPRFKHILVKKKRQGGRLGIALMMQTEKFLQDNNYKQYTAFILNENSTMINYATKFGFKEYGSNERGKWYYKNL